MAEVLLKLLEAGQKILKGHPWGTGTTQAKSRSLADLATGLGEIRERREIREAVSGREACVLCQDTCWHRRSRSYSRCREIRERRVGVRFLFVRCLLNNLFFLRSARSASDARSAKRSRAGEEKSAARSASEAKTAKVFQEARGTGKQPRQESCSKS